MCVKMLEMCVLEEPMLFPIKNGLICVSLLPNPLVGHPALIGFLCHASGRYVLQLWVPQDCSVEFHLI